MSTLAPLAPHQDDVFPDCASSPATTAGTRPAAPSASAATRRPSAIAFARGGEDLARLRRSADRAGLRLVTQGLHPGPATLGSPVGALPVDSDLGDA